MFLFFSKSSSESFCSQKINQKVSVPQKINQKVSAPQIFNQHVSVFQKVPLKVSVPEKNKQKVSVPEKNNQKVSVPQKINQKVSASKKSFSVPKNLFVPRNVGKKVLCILFFKSLSNELKFLYFSCKTLM